MSAYNEVILFKSELKNLRLLKTRLAILQAELEQVIYLQENVRAIDPSKEAIGGGSDENIVIKYIERKDSLIHDIEVIEYRIKWVEDILSCLSENNRKIVEDIYIYGMSYDDVAEREGYSTIGMKKHVNILLKSILSIPK